MATGKRISLLTLKEVQQQFELLKGDPIWTQRPTDARRPWAQLKQREAQLKEREHAKSRAPFTPEERAAMRRKGWVTMGKTPTAWP